MAVIPFNAPETLDSLAIIFLSIRKTGLGIENHEPSEVFESRMQTNHHNVAVELCEAETSPTTK